MFVLTFIAQITPNPNQALISAFSENSLATANCLSKSVMVVGQVDSPAWLSLRVAKAFLFQKMLEFQSLF